MSFLYGFVQIILHIDKYLNIIIGSYGTLTYLILFAVIFCETGFVVTPFLPGDSVLFAVGAIASLGMLNAYKVFFLLALAAIAGDTVNFFIGHKIGNKLLAIENPWLIKKEYIKETRNFYEKYGPFTIVIARFIPIIRSFAPFVAGIGAMKYDKFISYNIAGGILWTFIGIFAGYFFGNIPLVKNNFSLILLGIIFVSIIPAAVGVLKKALG